MRDKVGENPAALRAAVFLLSAKNRRGRGVQTPPPPAGRRLKCSSDTARANSRAYMCHICRDLDRDQGPILPNGVYPIYAVFYLLSLIKVRKSYVRRFIYGKMSTR